MNARTVYFTGGTEEGFFTAVFDGYNQPNAYLTSEKNIQLSLGERTVKVLPDMEKAARVERKMKRIDARAVDDVRLVLRHRDEEREQIAFLYIRELVKTGKSVRGKLSVEWVRRMMDLRGQVLNEVHRLKGFLRFSETSEGVLYAPCSPDHDDVELLAPHFIARLNAPFVIHDVWRRKALLYDGRECIVAAVGDAEIVESERERYFSSLWKKYYQSVNIAERKNLTQQRNYMPVRYWNFLTEQP
jgi:probable DNA metabolism protein